jgi:hypothetical protein
LWSFDLNPRTAADASSIVYDTVPELRAETVDGRLNRWRAMPAWLACFPRKFGYYVPKPDEMSHPVEKGRG